MVKYWVGGLAGCEVQKVRMVLKGYLAVIYLCICVTQALNE